ncbi:hypothetical protein ACLD9W_08025 [Neisseria sp. WLZKY-1]|uniref:hypothetical protein n=1 Tax=Neisseria sp. WLZKY-1 TaxID=3390377 RepID=UPI00397E872F
MPFVRKYLMPVLPAFLCAAALAAYGRIASGNDIFPIMLVLMPCATGINLACAVFRRPRRALHLAKAALWTLAAVVFFCMVLEQRADSLATALQTAAKIEKFHADTGCWPNNPAAANVGQTNRPPLFYYPPSPPCSDKTPLLRYADNVAGKLYDYDFVQHRFPR